MGFGEGSFKRLTSMLFVSSTPMLSNQQLQLFTTYHCHDNEKSLVTTSMFEKWSTSHSPHSSCLSQVVWREMPQQCLSSFLAGNTMVLLWGGHVANCDSPSTVHPSCILEGSSQGRVMSAIQYLPWTLCPERQLFFVYMFVILYF